MKKEFYPPTEPFHSGYLKVSPLHEIYFEECGNPLGQPALFLHGGPGGGIAPDHRRFFDPNHYRIILLDQRGSGKSKPLAEIQENTTWDLVEDIEKLRSFLNIEKWLVFGGSWGSTLALSYASKHSQHISAMVLRGIFLCRPSEIKWFYQEGASHLFPDYWEQYENLIPAAERKDFVSAYYKRLTSADPEVRLAAAKAWSKWEAATSRLFVSEDAVEEFDDPDYALSFARIECHYFTNNAFFSNDNYLISQVDQYRHIPTTIVQGRYDVVCPARSAWDLHKAWPEAQLQIIAAAGHAAAEPGIRSALIQATDAYRSR
jgi:proline iminopeptidase